MLSISACLLWHTQCIFSLSIALTFENSQNYICLYIESGGVYVYVYVCVCICVCVCACVWNAIEVCQWNGATLSAIWGGYD